MQRRGISTLATLIIVALVILAGSYWYFTRQKAGQEILPSKTFQEILEKNGETPSPEAKQPVPGLVSIRQTVENFMENFLKTAPPNPDQDAAQKAANLLSQKSRESLGDPGISLTGALARFAGVQDLPNQGYSIDKINEEKGRASVETTWKYSGRLVKKTFQLAFENGSWKIDSIR